MEKQKDSEKGSGGRGVNVQWRVVGSREGGMGGEGGRKPAPMLTSVVLTNHMQLML